MRSRPAAALRNPSDTIPLTRCLTITGARRSWRRGILPEPSRTCAGRAPWGSMSARRCRRISRRPAATQDLRSSSDDPGLAEESLGDRGGGGAGRGGDRFPLCAGGGRAPLRRPGDCRRPAEAGGSALVAVALAPGGAPPDDPLRRDVRPLHPLEGTPGTLADGVLD